ncbi:MAG: enoyl-CoA hydratase/isomerase family protein [Acidimicrobiia bacterium]
MAITVEHIDGVRIVTINRPERRNALDPDTMAEIGDTFTEAETNDDVRVMVLTGAGDQAFCAGADLKAFAAAAPAVPGAPTRLGTEVFVERTYPKPIIAAVNGTAVGGGLGIALGCDIIVAADHARFGTPEVQRGLVGAGVGSRMAKRLPLAIAMELILTGEPISATRAFELGLINRVVPLADLMPATMAMAARIAANGPMAVRVSKQIIHDVSGAISGIDMPALRAQAAPVMSSADAKEGARAFAEKRPPNFTGR